VSRLLRWEMRWIARFMLACNEVGFWPRMSREEWLWWRERALR
jgi:hypothetical protein